MQLHHSVLYLGKTLEKCNIFTHTVLLHVSTQVYGYQKSLSWGGERKEIALPTPPPHRHANIVLVILYYMYM